MSLDTRMVVAVLAVFILSAGCRIDPEAISEAFDDRRVTLEWSDGDYRFKFQALGDFTVNESATRIESLGDGGEFVIEKERGS